VHKTVENVIAAARILIRRPSEQKLASDDMRYLLHNVLDELNGMALKRNRDYFTSSELITLAYSAPLIAYTITLSVTGDTEFYPIHLVYQNLNQNPDTDPWYKVNHVKISQYPTESNKNAPVYALLETVLGATKAVKIRLNLKDEFVQQQRWRLDYRAFPKAILQFTDTVPFPQEHTVLLETALAEESIQLVSDNSADWVAFKQSRYPSLGMKKMVLIKAFNEWLDRDIENIIITDKPYHYIRNNPQMQGRLLNLRTEPQ